MHCVLVHHKPTPAAPLSAASWVVVAGPVPACQLALLNHSLCSCCSAGKDGAEEAIVSSSDDAVLGCSLKALKAHLQQPIGNDLSQQLSYELNRRMVCESKQTADRRYRHKSRTHNNTAKQAMLSANLQAKGVAREVGRLDLMGLGQRRMEALVDCKIRYVVFCSTVV